MRAVIPIWFLIISLSQIKANDNPVYRYIDQGDIPALEAYLREHDINEILDDSTTLLVYSVNRGNRKISEYLIREGADVEQRVKGLTPLMHAASGSDARIINLLLESAVDVHALDAAGNTALFYAAANGSIRTCRLLLKAGIPIGHRNNRWKTARDFALFNRETEVTRFLQQYYERNLPDLLDGPYVKWGWFDRVRAFYISHDAEKGITHKRKKSYKAGTVPFLMEGFSGDTLDYLLYEAKPVPGDDFAGAGRILVMGDVHGGYDSLVQFLVNNDVITSQLNWNWGMGHLVFLGDVFDRGDRVTEALWLIYRLEDQAMKAGGRVHYLLGNHEIMVLLDNIQYISDKYRILTDRINIEYSSLFCKRCLLGQWLRNLNTMLRIDDHLFVHAGLSTKFVNSGLDIRSINDMTRFFLDHPERERYRKKIRSLVLGTEGPFWYRGFIEDNHEYDLLPEKDLDRILDYYSVSRIFIGHTNVEHITPRYGSKVYALDVPYYTFGYSMEALLIEGEEISVLSSDGARTLFKD